MTEGTTRRDVGKFEVTDTALSTVAREGSVMHAFGHLASTKSASDKGKRVSTTPFVPRGFRYRHAHEQAGVSNACFPGIRRLDSDLRNLLLQLSSRPHTHSHPARPVFRPANIHRRFPVLPGTNSSKFQMGGQLMLSLSHTRPRDHNAIRLIRTWLGSTVPLPRRGFLSSRKSCALQSARMTARKTRMAGMTRV